MATFLYVGADARDFPSDDGVTPSFSVQPGDTVEADTNPNPAWFDATEGNPTGSSQSTTATVTETAAETPQE